MEENKENKENKITRKRFLNVCGSLVAAGGVAGVAGTLVHKMVALPDQPGSKLQPTWKPEAGRADSPYRMTSAFQTEGEILGFDLLGDLFAIALPNGVAIYDRAGKKRQAFPVEGEIRDLAVYGDLIYVLLPTAVKVYDGQGNLAREWAACSEESDYCALVVAKENVYVTDAANKNVCQYATDGTFRRFIQSPNGFVIPSYTFGITAHGDKLYCSNSGRHLIESYTLDGEYLEAFGKPGGAEGLFRGCCNPVYVEHTSTGELITSEKGIPRVSCYSPDGTFRATLLEGQALGGGTKAYRVKPSGSQLFVCGKDKVALFQYDKEVAAATACGTCTLSCPLREGLEDVFA